MTDHDAMPAPAPAALRPGWSPEHVREEGPPADHAAWEQRRAGLGAAAEALIAELTRLQGRLEGARAGLRPNPADSEQRSRALRAMERAARELEAERAAAVEAVETALRLRFAAGDPVRVALSYGYEGEILTVRAQDEYGRVYVADDTGIPQGWFHPADIRAAAQGEQAKTREHILAEITVDVHALRERIEAFERDTGNLANFALVATLEETEASLRAANLRAAGLERAADAARGARVRDLQRMVALHAQVAASLDALAGLARATQEEIGPDAAGLAVPPGYAELAAGAAAPADQAQLAAEVARLTGELAARDARIEELSAELARLHTEPSAAEPGPAPAEAEPRLVAPDAETPPYPAPLAWPAPPEDPPPAPARMLSVVPGGAPAVALGPQQLWLLRELGRRRTWNRADVDQLCEECALVGEEALVMLNAAAVDRTGEPLWAGRDPIELDLEVLARMA